MKNNTDKNNTRGLNLQVCTEIYQIEFYFLNFFLFKTWKGKNEKVNHNKKFKKIFAWKRMHQVLNRHFTVQNSVKEFARHPFNFPKHCFMTRQFHEPSMAVSGRCWGLVARVVMGFLHWWRTWCWLARATPPPLQRSSKDLNRIQGDWATHHKMNNFTFSPGKEKCRWEVMSNLWLKPQSLIFLIFLCHGPTFTACRSKHLKNQCWN